MKKVLKFVKGKKDERKESGGITPSQSGDLASPAQTPEDERFLGVDNSGYVVDFCGRDKTLTKLHKAAWQGNLDKLKSALKKVEIDAVDRHNRSALHFAVAQGHPNIVWFLLGNNANVSICDDEGHTPLLKAVECGHRECMNLLLDRGADVNASDYTGNTGLHIAVAQGSLDTVSLLLKKGALTEISNNAGDYPLHIATKLESRDLVDSLLRAGAVVDVLDRENRTPLMLAAKTGNCILVQLFAERNALLTVVDSNGWTAQDYAMLGGHENVAASLKPLSKSEGKKNEKSGSSNDEEEKPLTNGRTEGFQEKVVAQKFQKFFEKRLQEEEKTELSEKERNEEFPESPDVEAIPPYCQPPKSWEMIQAGMIDENKNGNEPKRRSITALGTLHSRRESFTEGSVSSPQSTRSLNRRKGVRESNAFARQRFSLNEEDSLSYWTSEEKTARKERANVEVENPPSLEEIAALEKENCAVESDWDSVSVENSKDSEKLIQPDVGETGSAESRLSSCRDSESGTLGREGTMRGIEEMWVADPRMSPGLHPREQNLNSWDGENESLEKEGNFPPPPTALELGVDMAKSIKCMKGVSVDQPPGRTVDRYLWKNFHDSHSLDGSEEKDIVENSTENGVKAHSKHQPDSPGLRKDFYKSQRSKDKFTDVSKRINEQLECYDQALRELAESSKGDDKVSSPNYYSLPSAKTGSASECRRASSQELGPEATFCSVASTSHSLPLAAGHWPVENNEMLGSEIRVEEPVENSSTSKSEEKLGKQRKRHMLLAMRDVRHAVQVASTFRTSVDDQILSPLAKPEDSFDLAGNSSPKGVSSGVERNSPLDENPFFGIARQETVLERNSAGRKSSSSGTGDESTLWLQDEVRSKRPQSSDSEDDVSEIALEEKSKHKRVTSFSPLGVIQREMEEEIRKASSSERDASATERRPPEEEAESIPEDLFRRRNEDSRQELSPDVSLSSGPLEPLGAEKDSGSEPESSHNDVSPTHNYALKSQHEWLKCHLRVATSEKSKLEELTAQLAEKTERLQYELADAKEAAKSRDEVIQLLQNQLARMEAAYTKSLEESVQSRLQLTSHEQEILHLKELCFRYEEEKEIALSRTGGDALQELHLKVKMLEEEKRKMKEEIVNLEEEKLLLEKRLKQEKKEESEMIDQCQRWKERCGELEELAKAYDAKQNAFESFIKEKDQEFLERESRLSQQNFQLEKKCLELNEENIELKGKVQCLSAEMKVEKRRANSRDDVLGSVAELKRKNFEMEVHLKSLEKEMEEKMMRKLKEKEEEVGGLVKQFNRERESLVASYEKKLMERKTEQSLLNADDWKKENHRLRRMVKDLQEEVIQLQMNASATLRNEFHQLKDEWNLVSELIAEIQRNPQQLNALVLENLKLKREMNDLKRKMEEKRDEEEKRQPELAMESAETRKETLQANSQMSSLKMLLDRERWPSTDSEHHKDLEKKFKTEGRRRAVGKKDELAWSSLYGMNAIRRRRSARSTSVTEKMMKDTEKSSDEEVCKIGNEKSSEDNILKQLNAAAELVSERNSKCQKLEFLELKKEILTLQSRMSDEKNLRHALENQLIKINLDLNEKENLEKEVNSLKRKVDRDCLRRSEKELLDYQKELDAKREKCLKGPERRTPNDNCKEHCEVLAKEREKFKELKNAFARKAKSFECTSSEGSPPFKVLPCPRPRPEFFAQPRLLALDPDVKSKLDRELDRSIKKYTPGSSSAPSISNVQIEFVEKKYF